MYFIDTNIFIYAAGDDGELTTYAKRVIEHIAADDMHAISSITVLEEVIYLMARWARHHNDAAFYDKGKRIVTAAMVLLDEVLLPTPQDFSRALYGWQPGTDFNDLLIVETMHTRGIDTIISADKGFDRWGVARIAPTRFG